MSFDRAHAVHKSQAPGQLVGWSLFGGSPIWNWLHTKILAQRILRWL